MEVASLQHLGDSFSRGWLNRGAQAMPPVADADLGYCFGSSRSFIDMDPAEHHGELRRAAGSRGRRRTCTHHR
jgi:hypothetical protein